jgi:hypothetical protein
MIKASKLGIWLGSLLWIGLWACTEERLPCDTPKIASLNIQTVHHPTDTTTAIVDTALPAAVFGAVTNKGIQDIVYPQQANFTISLSPLSDSCQYYFTTDSAYQRVDTLKFYYQRSLYFISNACGFTYFYSLDSVHTTHFNIDSVLILNSSVTNNANITQLQFYIHTFY